MIKSKHLRFIIPVLVLFQWLCLILSFVFLWAWFVLGSETNLVMSVFSIIGTVMLFRLRVQIAKDSIESIIKNTGKLTVRGIPRKERRKLYRKMQVKIKSETVKG